MSDADGLSIDAVQSRPLIPEPGVVWRSCRFSAGPALGLVHHAPDGVVAISAPAELAGALDRRRSEFLAGRLCAALALRALNAPEAVGRRGRAPVWPPGLRGSISHARGRAVAAVARNAVALGVDCEAVMSPETVEETAPMILCASEEALRPPAWSPALFCTIAFSAKEALYKALADQIDDIPDFLEAEITAVGPWATTLAFRGRKMRVRHVRDGAFVVTIAFSAPPASSR